MFNLTNPNIGEGQVVDVPRYDRWLICYRLQDLKIPCACCADGTLRVDVNHCTDAVLVRSTVQQFTAPRQELVNWLERCWCTRYTGNYTR